MRRSPRVVALRLLAVVLALLTARLVATDLATLHTRARGLGELRPVLVARRAIPLGHVLTTDDVRVVERHASQVANTTLRSRADAVGRTAIVPLVADSPVLRAHLAPGDRTGTATLLAPGHRAVRVQAADGLRPPVGAAVDVLASLDPGVTIAGSDAPTLTVASGARVLATDGGRDGMPVGVVLEVTVEEASRLAFATANGIITLALAPPEDACCTDVQSRADESAGSSSPPGSPESLSLP